MIFVAAMALALASAFSQAAPHTQGPRKMNTDQITSLTLTQRQQAIIPIAAFAAAGDIDRLNRALEQGLNAGLPVNDAKEVLVQLYAYAGFPRSLNALGELMKVVEKRRNSGVRDEQGAVPSHPAPKGDALLAAGAANQTKLSGAPVKGALFEFAPAIDEYLKTHLFGDVFERDNLDWQSREIATVSMLSAMSGVESQLESHIRISMNVGISAAKLQEIGQVLSDRGNAEAGLRVRKAVAKVAEVAGG
jgi:4-carboxymuconolactone decarboxylase